MSSVGPAAVTAPEEIPAPRWLRHSVTVVVIAAFVTALLGTAFSPTLVANRPLWLTALNANNRYLILVTSQVAAPGFFVIALLRRVIPTLAFFLLGHWYGERAVAWIEQREAGGGEAIRMIERVFARVGWWAVAIAPMPITCLLAGAAHYRPRRLVPLVIVSITARLVLIRWLGVQFSGTLQQIVDWIDRSRRPLLVVTIGLVVITLWSQRKRRAESFEELAALEDEAVDPISGPPPV